MVSAVSHLGEGRSLIPDLEADSERGKIFLIQPQQCRSRMEKKFMRRGCSISISRRGALGSGLRLANLFRGREEQLIVVALVVSFLVIMFQEIRHDASQ